MQLSEKLYYPVGNHGNSKISTCQINYKIAQLLFHRNMDTLQKYGTITCIKKPWRLWIVREKALIMESQADCKESLFSLKFCGKEKMVCRCYVLLIWFPKTMVTDRVCKWDHRFTPQNTIV